MSYQIKDIRILIEASGEAIFEAFALEPHVYTLKYKPSNDNLSRFVHTQKGAIKTYKTFDALHADCKSMTTRSYTLHVEHFLDGQRPC